MSATQKSTGLPVTKKRSPLLASEDWWSVYLGLFLVVITWIAFAVQSPLNILKKAIPVSWPSSALMAHFGTNYTAYIFMFLLLGAITSVGIAVMGGKVSNYVPAFTVLFASALLILVLGSQQTLKKYGLEYPFWALVIGLIIGNLWTLPEWLKAATNRTEFFIKTGIVLLGANLSFNVIIKGGVWGFLEAALIVAGGFTTAFIVAKKLGFDNKFAAVLGAGGSVCGVSAAIAVGGAVEADEKHVGYVSSLVVLYALVLIFLLPALGKALGLTDYVTGAWIGGSELADAAGLAAAAIVSDKAVKAFSLVKLNRDVMIGFLCFIFAWIAVTRWDTKKAGATRPDPKVMWDRFPKFVLAFLAASMLVTWLERIYGAPISANVVANLNAIRSWLFVIAFLCIGCNTKIKDVRAMGSKPIIAFTAVVLVNVIMGFILANLFFGGIIASPLK
ncbi:MAG TPA: putative sulfate exporter family transporter [Symbiobacteriaceae bacterium]